MKKSMLLFISLFSLSTGMVQASFTGALRSKIYDKPDMIYIKEKGYEREGYRAQPQFAKNKYEQQKQEAQSKNRGFIPKTIDTTAGTESMEKLEAINFMLAHFNQPVTDTPHTVYQFDNPHKTLRPLLVHLSVLRRCKLSGNTEANISRNLIRLHQSNQLSVLSKAELALL